jgi:hypothetical protein
MEAIMAIECRIFTDGQTPVDESEPTTYTFLELPRIGEMIVIAASNGNRAFRVKEVTHYAEGTANGAQILLAADGVSWLT